MLKVVSSITLLLIVGFFSLSNAWWPNSDEWYPTGPYCDATTWASIKELGVVNTICYFKVDAQTTYLAFDATTAAGKIKYAALLTAYTNGKGIKFWAPKTASITIGGLGTGCDIQYLNVQP